VPVVKLNLADFPGLAQAMAGGRMKVVLTGRKPVIVSAQSPFMDFEMETQEVTPLDNPNIEDVFRQIADDVVTREGVPYVQPLTKPAG